MSHVYHDQLPEYDPRNVLHDGCPECEKRAEDPLHALLYLDADNRLQLWRDMRAVKFATEQGGPSRVDRNVSRCDTRLLNALYDVAVFLERAGLSPAVMEARFAMTVVDPATVLR